MNKKDILNKACIELHSKFKKLEAQRLISIDDFCDRTEINKYYFTKIYNNNFMNLTTKMYMKIDLYVNYSPVNLKPSFNGAAEDQTMQLRKDSFEKVVLAISMGINKTTYRKCMGWSRQMISECLGNKYNKLSIMNILYSNYVIERLLNELQSD